MMIFIVYGSIDIIIKFIRDFSSVNWIFVVSFNRVFVIFVFFWSSNGVIIEVEVFFYDI